MRSDIHDDTAQGYLEPRRPRWRRTGRRALVVVLTIAMVALALPAVASAQDVVVNGEVIIVNPVLQPQPIEITPDGDIISIEGGDFMLPGCHETEVGTSCIGDFAGGGELLIDVGDEPIEIEGGAVERQALGWLVDEAITAVGAVYDLPLDGRIDKYAAGRIRAYMVSRILDIIDRAAYNVPLTADEARTLALVQEHSLDTDRNITRYAYEEYERFKSQGCLYVPPAAPAFVTEPVGLPAEVRTYCETDHSPLAAAFEFMPPQPSEQHFTTWGTYRNASELGLDVMSSPEMQANVLGTVSSIVFFGGVGAAAVAGGVTSALVGASASAATAIAGAIGSYSASFGYASLAAAGAAAGAVAIVVLAVVIAAIAIWQFTEYQKVGTNLADAANRAATSDDPFGLAALQAANQGKELREGMDPDNPPTYRQEAMVSRFVEMVTRWMTVGLGGVVQPDAVGVWEDSSTVPSRDWTWEVTDSQGTRAMAELQVPLPEARRSAVRFDRAWMVVTDTPGEPRAALEFEYQTPDGERAVVSRQADGSLLVSPIRPGEDGTSAVEEPFEADSIQFVDPDSGELVTARLVGPGALPALGGPRPTVAGSFVPGWVHNLRPNPVDVNGNFDLNRFRADYMYAWELDRFDEATQTWVDVPLLDPLAGEPPYGARFLPTMTGPYRATVTMTSTVDPNEPPASGVVEFEIVPPAIEIEEAVLVDDGFSQLRLDLHLAQNTGGGNFDVGVRWPGLFGSDEAPVTNVDIECLAISAVTCDTPRTADIPVLRSALTHQLGPLSDLSQGVQVTVTNDHGGQVTRTLAIDSADRPRFGPPPPPPADQPALVAFDPGGTSVQVPVASPTVDPNLVLATVELGPSEDPETSGFSIWDPTTGTVSGAILLNGNANLIASVLQRPDGQWVLTLLATPTMGDLGAFSIPIGVQQNNGQRAAMLLHVDIVPAPDDKYRVFLESDVNPDDFAVDHLPAMEPVIVNGRDGWEPYAGDLCVSLQNTNAGPSAIEKCAPIDDFRGSDGELTFPWAELYPDGVERGTHRARAWLADTDRSWPEPHQVTFLLRSGAPRITDLAWDNSTRQLVLTAEPDSANAPIEAITCTLDGSETPCFEPAGGPWAPPGLADGDHTLDVTVTDAAGNYDTAALAFTATTVDTTAPVITADVVGTPADNGWYVDDVTLTWTVTDDESEITTITGCEPATVDVDTSGQTFGCEATSEGGTTTESVTITRDATAPTVTVTGVDDGATYQLGGVPAAGCDTQDATSGVATPATLAVTGGHPDGTGEFTATCGGAVDNAGNTADAPAASYTVEAATPTYDDLGELTEALVGRRTLRRGLTLLVSTAERLDDRGFERAADRTLDRYVALVRSSTPRWIAPADADRLIALAQALRAG